MFRRILFWLHLAAGIGAGLIILIMSATGVALTYERQVNDWSASHLRSRPALPGATPLAADALLARARQTHPDFVPNGITRRNEADAPVVLTGEPASIYLDAYSGQELGDRRGAAIRRFQTSMRAWHRWLAADGDGRPLARAVTGWSNLLFLFIVASGLYLWMPRLWTWPQIRQVLFFRSAYGTAKARDFNWHNVLGFWTAIPLFIVVLGAVPISFPWANNLVFRMAGEAPPARPGPPSGAPARRTPGPAGRPSGAQRGARADVPAAEPALDGLDVALGRAIAASPGWKSVSVRFPRGGEDPFTISVDRGDGGQPQLRSTLTVNRTGDVVARETFADQSTGRQIRSVLRFAHTGEVLGLFGQTIAGLASFGAVVLVWTGLSLSFRRFRAWVPRLRPALTPQRLPWLALGVAAAAPGTADAQSMPPASPPHQSADVTRLRDVLFTFDIPGGPLAVVARQFEQITHAAVVLVQPDLGLIESAGVHGVMTAAQAAEQLLGGTGVHAVFMDDHIAFDIARVAEDVTVVATVATPSVSSPRYTVPLRDIAQTIALVPRTVIEQRAATTLTDVLRNVPGITLQAGEGGGSSNTAGDMFNMRGFSANNSLFVDNVRDSGLIARDVFNVEQVEVFMGPNGSDVGRGTAAGYVNMASKRPHLGTSMSVLATAGTANQGRLTADLNWSPAPRVGAGWWSRSGVRLNALWQDRGTPGRDFVTNASSGVAPAIALGLGTPTRVVASGQFVRQSNVPDYGIATAAWREEALAPTVVPTTQPVRQANFYGSPGFDYDKAQQNAGVVRAEHDLRRNLTIANQTRVNRTHRDAVVSAIANVAAYAPDTGQLTISRQGNERENTIVSNQTTIVGRFASGPLRHGVSGGVEVLREQQFAPGKQGLGTRGPVSLVSPNPRDPISDYAPGRSLAETAGNTHSVAAYGNDAIEIGTRWLLSGGFRLERYETDYRAVDATGATTTDLLADGTLASGRASALYRLNAASNVYLSYGTTVTPPGEANFQLSATANNVNNPNLQPQRSENLEVGTKIDLHGGRLALNSALFRTRNRNVIYTIDATAVPPLYNQDDEQLVRGATVGALGQVTSRWQVLANAAWLDATLQSQGTFNGLRIPLTPAFSGSLWTTVRVASGLSLGAGLQHVGRSFTNTANTIRVPAYTLADGLVEYAVNSHLTLRLNINNLTDAVYVKSVNNNGGRYNPGTRRSALLTSSVSF